MLKTNRRKKEVVRSEEEKLIRKKENIMKKRERGHIAIESGWGRREGTYRERASKRGVRRGESDTYKERESK